MFHRSVPEIEVKELRRKLQSDEAFVLLDVREPDEVERARITDRRVELAPMSQLGRTGASALPEAARDQQAEIYVLCHHGVRSAQVTNWLRAQGWEHAYSVRGGIDAYATEVDRSVGWY